jgi:hypothetical protein
MGKSYPFKFLDSYTSEDTDIFFGRDEEIDFLYEMIYQTNILLICGESGTGKTSLIQCGLAKRFQKYDWLPIFIRRGDNINQSLERILREEAQLEPEPDLPLEGIIESIYLKAFRPIYLIFDQFEELYILGTETEQKQFIETIERVLKIGDSVKILIVMREEYLGHLYRFEKKVPQLGRKKIRIESMNLDKVSKVLKGASAYKDSTFKLANEEENGPCERGENDGVEEDYEKLKAEDKIILKIFNTIKGTTKGLSIPLTYLQVFMDKLYMLLSEDEKREKEVVCRCEDVKKMPKIDDLLKSFLEDQVRHIHEQVRLSDPAITIEALWQMLSKFVTSNGTKEPVSENGLHEKLSNFPEGTVNVILEKFAKSQILKFNEKDQTWEIAHDSLAKRIADKEKVRLLIHDIISSQTKLNAEARGFLTEKQLNMIEPYLDKVTLNQAEMELIKSSREKVKKDLNFKKVRMWALRGMVALLTCSLFSVALLYRSVEGDRDALERLSNDLRHQVKENAETNYKKSSGSYDNFVMLANVLYGQNNYREALRFSGLAIRENFDYIFLVREARTKKGSDTVYRYPTIDHGAESARVIQKTIQDQLSMEKIIADVRLTLARGKESEAHVNPNKPLTYFESKIFYDSAEQKLKRVRRSNEFKALSAEIKINQSQIEEKLSNSLERLFDKASKFVTEPEGYPAAENLLRDAYKINPNDSRINELRKKMKK